MSCSINAPSFELSIALKFMIPRPFSLTQTLTAALFPASPAPAFFATDNVEPKAQLTQGIH